MPQPHITQVRIYSGVPWDNTYTDVRYFEGGSVSIPGTLLYQGTNASYQRVTSQISPPRISYSLRIGEFANNYYNANYLAFNNGSKWFYGFIKEVNYINLNCTEFIYEIDVFTTFFYDCTIHPSYVVREHSNTDEPGDNIVAEPISNLNLIDIPNASFVSTNSPVRYTLFVTAQPDGTYIGGQIINGLYTGAARETYTTLEAINERINEYATGGHLDSIVGIYNTRNLSENIVGSIPTTLDGYTPKNKKLLTFQFNRLACCAYDGSSQEFAYEFFNGNPSFSISSDSNFGGNAICVPTNYKGTNYNYSVSTNNQLACAWSGDQATQFIEYTGEMNAYKMLIGAGANLISVGTSHGNGLPITSILGDVGNIVEYGATAPITESMMNPSFSGGSGGSALWALNKVGFHGDQRCVNATTAKLLDEYFSAYGYSVNTTKQPNLTGRAYFNYVQLNSPCITGSIPSYAMSQIKRIFTRGVKLWHNNNIGNWNPEGGNPIG